MDENKKEEKKLEKKVDVKQETKKEEPKFKQVDKKEIDKAEKQIKKEKNKKDKAGKKSPVIPTVIVVVVVLLIAILLTVMIVTSSAPKKSLEALLTNLKAGDFTKAQEYVSGDLDLGTVNSNEETQKLLFDKLNWKTNKVTEKDENNATIEVEITTKDFQTIVNNYMQKDVISFSGKNVAQSLLDSHLDILKRMKEMTIIKNSAKSQIIESTNKLLENINSKIKPLLNDDDFLWIITPEREKNKFSASIVSYSIQNPRDNSEIMSLISSQIQKRILEGDSEILLNELKNAGQKITKPEQQKKLQQLKTYISKKLEIINSKEEKINMIEIEDLNNEERNHLEKVLNKNYLTANIDRKTFNRELVKRAIQKNSSLKEIYSNSYKENFNRIKNLYKKGEATQLASARANEEVVEYLKSGRTSDLAF